MDEYLPEKFKKLVGPTFANKAELKKVHPDYYEKKKIFVMNDKKPAVMVSRDEKEEVIGKLLKQGGFEITDDQMREIINADIENVSHNLYTVLYVTVCQLYIVCYSMYLTTYLSSKTI